MTQYLHAMGAAPVHLVTLVEWLRTRSRWLRLDVIRHAGDAWCVALRVGGSYATPDMAFEAAHHFRDSCGIPIGLAPPLGPDDDDDQDPPPKRRCTPRTKTKEQTS